MWHTYTFEEIQIPTERGIVFCDGTCDIRFDRGGIIDVVDWKIRITDEDGEDFPMTIVIPDLQKQIWEQIKWRAEEACYED
jgi:hypothetical protein